MTERFFNTSGPVVPEDHYCISPLERIDIDEALRLIRDKRYFVLHAPRQTGKTSTLLALQDYLNAGGEYRCVYTNVEIGQTAREDVEQGMRAVLSGLSLSAALTLDDHYLEENWLAIFRESGPHAALAQVLTHWSRADTRPLVLLIDEIDALVGDTLISVLRQLRSGYPQRPAAFPQSLVLCGVRDVRDYRIHSGSSGEIITGGSAFNIKAESLRVGDFTEAEVRALLQQHVEQTDQPFTEGALKAVWRQTGGQPWLVNALAYEACFRNKANRERTLKITEETIMGAQEALIRARQTHLHQLADKLTEARVQRVVEPILSGEADSAARPDDVEYVRDLGLIARRGPLRIANPIYREAIPRELLYAKEATILDETEWYVREDGELDVEKLLTAFQEFFREHSEHWRERFEYKEAASQLLLQAFLQRIVNGGGRIEREYALGSRRTDLLILWPQGGASGQGEPARPMRRHVIECKVLRDSPEVTLSKGLEQTLSYMDRCKAESGHLVLFDQREGRSWEEKIYRREETVDDRLVTVWGA